MARKVVATGRKHPNYKSLYITFYTSPMVTASEPVWRPSDLTVTGTIDWDEIRKQRIEQDLIDEV